MGLFDCLFGKGKKPVLPVAAPATAIEPTRKIVARTRIRNAEEVD